MNPTPAEIVNGNLFAIVRTGVIHQRRGGWFVDDAFRRQSRERRRFTGRLTLVFIEKSRDSDHSPVHLLADCAAGPVTQSA